MKDNTKKILIILTCMVVLMLTACADTSKESEATTLKEYTDVSIDDANFETLK